MLPRFGARNQPNPIIGKRRNRLWRLANRNPSLIISLCYRLTGEYAGFVPYSGALRSTVV
ncbi:hypothetical protein CE168_02970 [Bifidobacterium sp. N5G01]|nr:hypothetical protein CE168_02970 [Bifidobacterium sp. N5G01]